MSRPTAERIEEIRQQSQLRAFKGGPIVTTPALELLTEIDALQRELEIAHEIGERLSNERNDATTRALELESSLRPFAAMYREGDGVERIANTCPVTFYFDMYGTQSLTAGDLRRARAALGVTAAPEEEPK